MAAGTKIHPADVPIFDRMRMANGDAGHGLQLDCLPAPYAGPLRSAPVVFLYLSAGWTEQDAAEADTPKAQARQAAQWRGDALIPALEEHPSGWRWWASRMRPFDDLAAYRDKVAFLNISGYHSKDFQDYPLLTALPSCRTAVEWAQTVLFPQAEAGERVVVCLRSALFWGLAHGRRYGAGLFAPPVTRGGHMLRQGAAAPLFNETVEAVGAKLRR